MGFRKASYKGEIQRIEAAHNTVNDHLDKHASVFTIVSNQQTLIKLDSANEEVREKPSRKLMLLSVLMIFCITFCGAIGKSETRVKDGHSTWYKSAKPQVIEFGPRKRHFLKIGPPLFGILKGATFKPIRLKSSTTQVMSSPFSGTLLVLCVSVWDLELYSQKFVITPKF